MAVAKAKKAPKATRSAGKKPAAKKPAAKKPAAKKPAAKKPAAKKPAAGPTPFEVKVDAWFAVVMEAVGAPTAAGVKRAYAKAEALGVPADLFQEDGADEIVVMALHDRLNARVNERLAALPGRDARVHELCCLRDLINTT